MLVIFSFPVPSLAEQAKARKRQNQKERKMIKELEAAISDRDSLKKSHQVLGEEMEKLKAELAVTRAKYVFVLCAKPILLQYILCLPDREFDAVIAP